MEIRELAADDAAACDVIIAGLPEWFGDDRGVRDCGDAVRTQAGLVAEELDEVCGFLTWVAREGTAEITWMAVRADRRRRGLGRAMIEALVGWLREEGVRRLDVRTLSEREPYPAVCRDARLLPGAGLPDDRGARCLGPGELGRPPGAFDLTG